jgi:ubiquinone/menaquinone biosynthesis C-methylase UbiE
VGEERVAKRHLGESADQQAVAALDLVHVSRIEVADNPVEIEENNPDHPRDTIVGDNLDQPPAAVFCGPGGGPAGPFAFTTFVSVDQPILWLLVDETWDSIADWYAIFVRSGSPMHQFARDILLATLPESLDGLSVLDVGCGEGFITRALFARGAEALGVDPTATLIEYARAAEPSGPQYRLDDGASLTTVGSASMDWVTAGLSLNNIPDLDAAIASVRRVLKPAGRLVFTVPHPCFDAPRSEAVSIRGSVRRVVGDYLAEGLWRTTSPGSVRRAGNYHRALSTYVSAVTSHGFVLDVLDEPAPNDEVRDTNPHRAGLPPFLLIGAAAVE